MPFADSTTWKLKLLAPAAVVASSPTSFHVIVAVCATGSSLKCTPASGFNVTLRLP